MRSPHRARRPAPAARTADLLHDIAALVPPLLLVEYSTIFEAPAAGAPLLLRAGAGWRAGRVGRVTVPPGTGSPAGYTLLTGQSVVITNCMCEARFEIPALLREHGVRSSVTVPIGSAARRYGVLGADTTRSRTFTAEETRLLQAVADVLAAALARIARPAPAPLDSARAQLSGQEREVLRLLARGYANHEIAARLGVSVKTVETYRVRLARKLGFASRPELVSYALRTGLLDGSS